MQTIASIVLAELEADAYLNLPRRSYDFDKGDRRFRTLTRAVDHADAEAIRTGVRQVVRPDVDSLGDRLYLVQAVGS